MSNSPIHDGRVLMCECPSCRDWSAEHNRPATALHTVTLPTTSQAAAVTPQGEASPTTAAACTFPTLLAAAERVAFSKMQLGNAILQDDRDALRALIAAVVAERRGMADATAARCSALVEPPLVDSVLLAQRDAALDALYWLLRDYGELERSFATPEQIRSLREARATLAAAGRRLP